MTVKSPPVHLFYTHQYTHLTFSKRASTYIASRDNKLRLSLPVSVLPCNADADHASRLVSSGKDLAYWVSVS